MAKDFLNRRERVDFFEWIKRIIEKVSTLEQLKKEGVKEENIEKWRNTLSEVHYYSEHTLPIILQECEAESKQIIENITGLVEALKLDTNDIPKTIRKAEEIESNIVRLIKILSYMV